MKIKPERAAWLGLAAVLCFGAAAIITLKRSETTGAAERPNGAEETEIAIRSAAPARERETPAHEGVPAEGRKAKPPANLPLACKVGEPTAGGGSEERGRSANSDAMAAAGIDLPADSKQRQPRALGARAGHPGSDVGRSTEARDDDGAESPMEQAAAGLAAPPPPGIQLAADVRLPVAALPIDFQTNEVTARMLDIIVTDYYRDLAAGVTDDENEDQTTRVEEGGEATILVGNGPVAEAARHRADWRFRAIFGKEAFNRMSMQSNLEARLPVTDTD